MKKTLLGLSAAILLLAAVAGVMVWRASKFGVPPGAVAGLRLPEPPAVDVDTAAEMLGVAIRIQTVTRAAGDPQPGSDDAWRELRALLAARYQRVFSLPIDVVADHTLLVTWPGSDASLSPLILMAHQDVVPINEGTEADWTHGPFGGVVADGYVWGRGAMDDKGALVAVLEAAESLASSGWTPRRTIILLLGHDEEVAGRGAAEAFALLGTRGVTPVMVLDEGLAVLARLPFTGKPAALIGVTEKGYASLVLTAQTEGGHSSRPPRESGVVRIARAVVALEDNQMPADLSAPPLPDMIAALAPDLPFAARLAFANQWLLGRLIESKLTDPSSNALIRTTTAPTMLSGSIKDNVLPQRASAVVNFRIHPRDTFAEVTEHVSQVTRHVEGLTIEPYREGIVADPSPVSSIHSDAYRVLEAVAREAAGPGVPVAPALMIGATDARHAVRLTQDAIYRFVPAVYTDEELAGFHGTNERLSVENLGRMMRAYAQLMMALAG